MEASELPEPERTTGLGRWGLLIGVAFFTLSLALPVLPVFLAEAEKTIAAQGGTVDPSRLAWSMQAVAGLFFLMITWWVTEAVPLPVTALLPAIVLPAVQVVGFQGSSLIESTPRAVLTHYAHPVIYLFLGGFLLAAAMQRWGLDRRFTLWLLTRGRISDTPGGVLFGLMAATAALSMWISNTACAAMMLPLGLGIIRLLELRPGSSRFGTAIMLGIAWSASIGGMGTIIGTPPNGIALGILDAAMAGEPGFRGITFLDWMAIGVPIVVLMLPLAWLILMRLNPPEITSIPGGRKAMAEQRAALGSISRGERLVLGLFLAAAALWITNPFWDAMLPGALAERLAWIDEYHIGLSVGAIAFVLPVRWREGVFLLTWKDAKNIDWGTLLLFGGGIALSDAMFKTGLAALIAQTAVGMLGTPSTFLLMVFIVVLIDFLTEVTSNTAVTSMMVPVVIAIAHSTGANPQTLTVAAALAASMAFMLPVATPPNALVFGTGTVPLRAMIRNGFALDILGWFLVIGMLPLVAGGLFGILGF